MQLLIIANSLYQLWLYAAQPDPSAFQRFGTVMIVFGVGFLAFHGPNLIDWQIARKSGDEEAAQVHLYEMSALIVNVVLVCGGTLITGYGDWFVCGIHGKGFQSCSF